MRLMNVLVTILLSANLQTSVAPGGHPHGPADSWLLPSHSIERTLHWDDDSWLMSAASMAMQDRVLLLPSVADRAAFLWNKKAVASTDFEIIFTISGRLPDSTQQDHVDGIFAFWLSLDDCASQYDEKAIVAKTIKDRTKDWQAGLKEAGYSLLANKPNFKGFALIFLPFDAQKKLRQTIASIYTDGVKPLPSALEKVLEDEVVDTGRVGRLGP
eukprot:g31168.t1